MAIYFNCFSMWLQFHEAHANILICVIVPDILDIMIIFDCNFSPKGLELEFLESDVSSGKSKVKQGKFIEFIYEDEGLIYKNV